MTCRGLVRARRFFGARLLQRRLQDEGRWTSKVMKFVPERAGKSFGKKAPQKTLDKYRRVIQWRMNPGNWFLRFMEREIAAGPYSCSLHERILGVGVRELNRILDSKRGRRALARQP